MAIIWDGDRTITVEYDPDRPAWLAGISATVNRNGRDHAAAIWDFSLVDRYVRVYLQVEGDFDLPRIALFIRQDGRVAATGRWRSAAGEAPYASAPHELEGTRLVEIVSFNLQIADG
jgi:hypothetical protein